MQSFSHKKQSFASSQRLRPPESFFVARSFFPLCRPRPFTQTHATSSALFIAPRQYPVHPLAATPGNRIRCRPGASSSALFIAPRSPAPSPFPPRYRLFRSLYCPSLPGTVLFPVPAPFSPLPPPVTAARYAPAEPRQTKTPLHKQRGFPFGTLPCYLRRKNDGISKSSSLSFSFSAKSSISSNFGTTTGLTGFLALAREMPRILSIKRWRVGSSGSS